MKSAREFSQGHQLVLDPEEADIILYCDPGPWPLHLSILIHPIFRKWHQKCFLYNERDYPSYWCRGFLVSGSNRSISSRLHRGAAYVRSEFSWSDQLAFPEQETFLFSFVGSSETHAVRQRLKSICEGVLGSCFLDVPRAITQTAFSCGDLATIQRLREQFVNTCRESLFVLCPRGVGASSIRLFEVMSMGRAPVVISDDWIPPYGADWDKIIIRIPENRIHLIPTVLNKKRDSAREMGVGARNAWDHFYSPARHFATLVEACMDLMAEPTSIAFSKRILFGEVFSYNGLRLIAKHLRSRIGAGR